MLSDIRRSETRGAKNRSGILRLKKLIDFEGSASYAAHGGVVVAFIGELGTDKSGRWLTRIEFFALDRRGIVRPWRKSTWHTFHVPGERTAARSNDRLYDGARQTIHAVDPLSGSAAFPDRDRVQEWDASRSKMVYRALPRGTMLHQLHYLRGRLFLTTTELVKARLIQRAKAPTNGTARRDYAESRRLWAATPTGWTEVGPYYIYGKSESGRFVVARNVLTGEWWQFDSGKRGPTSL